ncbi:acetyl-CoA carboxylase biotin carboxyl carrier protein [Actinophytocola xinjiangensis]|uniref:acetyl-CoA carboxylase biotin carboxyl carrier protein n=1 Tax=Actinophytocola xinjiangensis TaxID=485602 RepID=UPI000A8029FB|nr:biotin/lipoyl-containing protein [Actinophytocola xinjiangensis]
MTTNEKPFPMTDERFTVLLGQARDLARLVDTTGVRRIALSLGQLRLEIEAGAAPVTITGAPLPPAPPPEADLDGHVMSAPLVGVFFRAPEPGAPPFVEAGDRVEVGQRLAIVEAMKMMNDVVADRAGVVRTIHVTNGEVVEHGQPLFTVEPA